MSGGAPDSDGTDAGVETLVGGEAEPSTARRVTVVTSDAASSDADTDAVDELTPDTLTPRSVPARALVGAVRIYQYAAAGRPSPCRHDPSCSTYAMEALAVHGAVKGSWLAVRRLGRCQPWGTSGYDPVPAAKGQDR